MKCNNSDCYNQAKVKFCSRSCAAKVNNKLHPKRKAAARELICLNCDATLLGKSQMKFCSPACSGQYKRDNIVKQWLAGKHNGSIEAGGMSKSVREYLLAQAGHKCPRCGWCEVSEFSTKPILTIDHIDGDWTNNSVENLRVLCYNCHTLTGTFGSRNKSPIPRRYVNRSPTGL